MRKGRHPRKHLGNDPLALVAETGRTLASSSNLDHSYTDEEREFLIAIDRYKQHYRRPHPTWIEVLAVLRSLGWHKESIKHSEQEETKTADS